MIDENVRSESLTPAQAYFLANKRKFVWFCAGRGSGKTFIAAIYVLMMAMRYPKARGLIAANTYHQLHSATMIPILAYLESVGMDYRLNKRPPASWTADLPFAVSDYKGILVLENGAHIFLRSLDKPEGIRGIEVGWFLLDEIASSTRTAWDIIIGTLRDKNSKELFGRVVGSPDGFNWTAEEFDKRFSKDPAVACLYDIVFMSSRENPHLPPEFLEAMLSSYDRRRALQEVDGRILIDQDFNTYYEFRPTIHVKDLIPYNPNQPLILSWDFNSSQNAPMSMIVSQQHQFSNGVPFVQVLDEFVIHGGNTPMVCDAFLKRYYPTHKSSIKVYGDASGTRSTVGTSDFQVVKECLGPRFPSIEFFVPRKNMTIKDRVNAVNAMLLNAKGEIRLFIHPQCKELIEDCKKVKPNNHGLIDKSDPARTHTSDAVGYYIAREFPVKFAAPAGINSISGLNLNER